ncbi:MAG: hypothetical protein AAGE76_08325 [Pseudomonadota bacterium]
MFRLRPLVTEDISDWVDAAFDWFDDRFPAPPQPILPTPDFFMAPSGRDEATARKILADVQRLMGADQPLEIVPIRQLPAEWRVTVHDTADVAGTFQQADGVSVISYDPELMANPLAFINMVVHEVMHARLAGLDDDLPGGPKAVEPVTDLGCIIAGFGIFQLETADRLGWAGYLSQQTRAHALAVFLQRRGLGEEAIAGFLSSRCKKLLRRAARAL